MTDTNLFDQTLTIAAKALDLRSRRHDAIVSNIVNADTPGYKAFDILVDKALADSSKSGAAALTLDVQRSHPAHLPGTRMTPLGLGPYRVEPPAGENLRGDGNTVDIEREMANLSSNQLMYKTTAQIISKKLQWLSTVIKGGKG
jgi:flagellar basal-body rod protein FlgB